METHISTLDGQRLSMYVFDLLLHVTRSKGTGARSHCASNERLKSLIYNRSHARIPSRGLTTAARII